MSTNMLDRTGILQQLFKSTPVTCAWRAVEWIHKMGLFKCVLHATEVARGAGYNEVRQFVASAARVRQQMVVLGPHALKGGMLLRVPPAPNRYFGIQAPQTLSHLLPYDRNPAETAVIAIPYMKRCLDGGAWHTKRARRAFSHTRGIGPFRRAATVLPPNGVGPSPHGLAVRLTKQIGGQITSANKVGQKYMKPIPWTAQ